MKMSKLNPKEELAIHEHLVDLKKQHGGSVLRHSAGLSAQMTADDWSPVAAVALLWTFVQRWKRGDTCFPNASVHRSPLCIPQHVSPAVSPVATTCRCSGWAFRGTASGFWRRNNVLQQWTHNEADSQNHNKDVNVWGEVRHFSQRRHWLTCSSNTETFYLKDWCQWPKRTGDLLHNTKIHFCCCFGNFHPL